MTINDGGPSFPCPEMGVAHFNQVDAYPGMSLRDWFAGKALDGILSHSTTCSDPAWKSDRCSAQWAYQLADAMIEERTKQR